MSGEYEGREPAWNQSKRETDLAADFWTYTVSATSFSN